MSILIKEYNIPFIGTTELIESSRYDETFNGKYYMSINAIKVIKNCSSLEELTVKAIEKIIEGMIEKKAESEEAISKEKAKIEKLEANLLKIKSNGEDYLKEYQTKNLLQREFQEQNKRQNPLKI